MFRLAITAVVTSIIPSLSIAQPTTQRVDIQSKASAIAEVSNQVKAATIIGGLRKLVIEGQYSLSAWWLAATELEFKPGSSIVISVMSQNKAVKYLLLQNKSLSTIQHIHQA